MFFSDCNPRCMRRTDNTYQWLESRVCLDHSFLKSSKVREKKGMFYYSYTSQKQEEFAKDDLICIRVWENWASQKVRAFL